MSELEKLKPLIRSVLLSEPEGVPMFRLKNDYEVVTSSPLPLKNLGFNKVEDLCRALNDVIRMQPMGGSYLLFAVSHKSCEHVEKLIANQKKKKKPHSLPTGMHGSTHFNTYLPNHRSSHFRSSQPRVPPSSPRGYRPPQPQRQVTFAHRVQRSSDPDHPVRSNTDFNSPPNNMSKPARSIWDRLGKSPQIDTSSFTKDKNTSFRSDVPRRISNSDESTTISSSPPLSPQEKGSWIVPPKSTPWRHEYSESRNFTIPDLITYARPRELILVKGYFLGDRTATGHRILKSGRKLNTNMVQFPLYHTNSTNSQVITCSFCFPNWANATYTSPNEVAEGTKLKIVGEHQSTENQHVVEVKYVEVFHPNETTPPQADAIELKMSSLTIDYNSHTVTQPYESNNSLRKVDSTFSNYSSEASDTSVYTDSDKNTTDEYESPDQGYSSPIPPPSNTDFPPSSSLNLFNIPKEFSSSIRSITNLRHFYLSINTDGNHQSPLDSLTTTLTNYHQSLNQPTPSIPVECKGLLCSAFHQNSSTWQRAKFLQSSSPSFSHFSILFIDLGEEAQLPPAYIRSFPVQFLQLRAQAILCGLPIPNDLAADPHLISIFRNLVAKPPLKTRLLNVSDGNYEVDLTTGDNNIVSAIMSAATNRNTQPGARSRSNSAVILPSQLSIPEKILAPNGYNNDVSFPVTSNGFFSPTNPSPPIQPSQPLRSIRFAIPPNPPIQPLQSNQNMRSAIQLNPTIPSLPPRLHISTSIPSPTIPHSPLFSPTFQSPIVPPTGYSYLRGAITNNQAIELPNELRKLVTYGSLPAIRSRTTFPVKITSIISPDKFYIQNLDNKQALADLNSSIQFYCKANEQETTTSTTVMEYCLAECRPGEWYRVQVISWNRASIEARVLLLDYGAQNIVSLNKLVKLTANHLKLPFQAICVNLNGVSPTGNGWSEKALDYFKSLTLDKVMWACLKHMNSIILVNTGEGQDVCIHERLISEGLANASN